jgi:hypothetical protein
MAQTAADTTNLLLNTACIRKESYASAIGFNEANLQKEHFIELQVIIAQHAEVYKEFNFSRGVAVLLFLRDEFNNRYNVFQVPKRVNDEKNLLTRHYLQGFGMKAVSNDLRFYIDKVANSVLTHYFKQGKLRGSTNKLMRRKLLRYLKFLVGCAKLGL